MMKPEQEFSPMNWWVAALFVASLIHVFVESLRRRDMAIIHTLMVALVIWPISYLFWILWWPGSLRKWARKKYSSDRS